MQVENVHKEIAKKKLEYLFLFILPNFFVTKLLSSNAIY